MKTTNFFLFSYCSWNSHRWEKTRKIFELFKCNSKWNTNSLLNIYTVNRVPVSWNFHDFGKIHILIMIFTWEMATNWCYFIICIAVSDQSHISAFIVLGNRTSKDHDTFPVLNNNRNLQILNRLDESVSSPSLHKLIFWKLILH